METKTVATIAGAAAAGGVLAFAGLSLASAATGTTTAAAPAGTYGYGQMRGGPGGMHGTPVTGEAADQVKAAIAEKYPDATVQMVEEEGDGYEAHVTKADGTTVHVTLDSNFAITGEHTGPPAGTRGGPGGMHGTPVTGEAADQVKAAIAEKYPDATVQMVEEEGDGYEAHVTKADGTTVHVTLDSNFAVTGEHTGPPAGMRGGPGHHEKQLTGATARKVKAAAKQKIPNGTVIRVEKDRGGVYEAHVIKKNGKEVVVTVNKKFKVTGVEAMRFGPPQGMPQGQGAQQGA